MFCQFICDKILNTQECIPVGCVPSATVAVCFQGGSPPPRSRPPHSRHPLSQVPPGPGTPSGTRHPPWDQAPPQDQAPPWEQTPYCKACWDTICNAWWDSIPPVDRMTDTCKNITFATSLRMVKMMPRNNFICPFLQALTAYR